MRLIPTKHLKNQICFFCHVHNTEIDTPVKYMMRITYPIGTPEGYQWCRKPSIPICGKCLQKIIDSNIKESE